MQSMEKKLPLTPEQMQALKDVRRTGTRIWIHPESSDGKVCINTDHYLWEDARTLFLPDNPWYNVVALVADYMEIPTWFWEKYGSGLEDSVFATKVSTKKTTRPSCDPPLDDLW